MGAIVGITTIAGLVVMVARQAVLTVKDRLEDRPSVSHPSERMNP
jgi:hypothetical protein